MEHAKIAQMVKYQWYIEKNVCNAQLIQLPEMENVWTAHITTKFLMLNKHIVLVSCIAHN